MHLLSPAYLDAYAQKLGFEIYPAYRAHRIRHKTDSPEDFAYCLVASSVFSSRIEEVTLDMNSFMRNRKSPAVGIRKEVREIESLIAAHQFAVDHPLTLRNILAAHRLLSAGLPSVRPKQRGAYRQQNTVVYDTATGRMVYAATEAGEVAGEIKKLEADMTTLLARQLAYQETFYYASMLHLWTAMIHPFVDGNGRTARLVEKWFLASKLGRETWGLRTEKYYWENRPAYYQNIALSLNYYVLKWERCLPFLLMLPESLQSS